MSKSVSCKRSGLRSALTCRKGVTALEFALIAPVFFALLLGTMELARYWYTAEAVRSYTAELLRAAIVVAGADNPPQQDICNGTLSVSTPLTPGLDQSRFQPWPPTVTCTRNSVTRTVEVSTTYNFEFVIGGLIASPTITDRQSTTF